MILSRAVVTGVGDVPDLGSGVWSSSTKTTRASCELFRRTTNFSGVPRGIFSEAFGARRASRHGKAE